MSLSTNKNIPAKLSWFTKSTFKFTPLLLELTIIAIVVRLIGMIQSFVFQTLIDRVIPFQRFDSLQLILFILIGATVFSTLLGAASGYLGVFMANRLTSELGQRIYDHVFKIPLLKLQKWQIGEFLARIQEIDTVRVFLTGTVTSIILDLIFIVVYIIALLSISPFLTMIVVIMLPLQIVVFGIIGPFLRARMQDEFYAGSIHQARFVEILSNIVTVKSTNSEILHRDRVSQTLSESLSKNFLVEKLNILNSSSAEIFRNLSIILIIYFGSSLVFENTITLGQLIAFHLLAQNVSTPIFGLSKIWEQWQGFRIARFRLGDLLNEDSEFQETKNNLVITELTSFHAENISFAYDGTHKTLNTISMSFELNKVNVIVGDSWCGKSTLAKVLSGLYPSETGAVFLNKHNIQNYDPRYVRNIVSYVPQEPTLFSGTIKDNLLMANSKASDEFIDEVLVMSSAIELKENLPHGLETFVGERGSLLSGGQRQRISLACSLLSDPHILILDEPTSSLDEASATQIMNQLAQLASTKLIIVITHRPDLIQSDRTIFNLNTGKEELLLDE